MKKLRVLGVSVHVELPEKIESGTIICLDEDIIISTGQIFNTKMGTEIIYKPLEKNIHGQRINEKIYFNAEELKPETRESLKMEDLRGRKPTVIEADLIRDHIIEKINKNGIFETYDEPTIDLRVFDISDTNKLVFNLVCILNTFTNGEKEIFQDVEKYNIRHGLVYDIDSSDDLLDFDEDISDITSIL